VLSRETVRRLAPHLPDCKPRMAGMPEDLALSSCLAELEIYVAPTRDELDRERFHPFNPEYMLSLKDCMGGGGGYHI